MEDKDRRVYKFAGFCLDAAEKQLKQDRDIVPLPPKEFETLLVLVKNAGHLVLKADLLDAVWGGTHVEEANINLIISNLRKAIRDNAGRPEFIETVRKRGFRFIADVSVIDNGLPGHSSPDLLPVNPVNVGAGRKRPVRRYLFIGLPLIALVSTLTAGLLIRRSTQRFEEVEAHLPFEEQEVKRVVTESQVYETLTIYTDPKSFDSSQLAEYWVPEQLGGKEIKVVQTAVNHLLEQGWRYEKGSRVELFQFRYIKVFAPGDHAEAGTIERWYIPTCREDGSRVLDKNVF